ncbi:hypothetical protein MTO96_029263 [Rhipicephalus appendiculatus]
MRAAPKVTFVVCRDGYRAIVDNKLVKGFNPLSVADIAKAIGVDRKSEPGKDIKESHFRGDVDLLGVVRQRHNPRGGTRHYCRWRVETVGGVSGDHRREGANKGGVGAAGADSRCARLRDVLLKKLATFRTQVPIDPMAEDVDLRAFPENHKCTWSTWLDVEPAEYQSCPY